MSYADKLFIDMCSDIIENGYSTEGEKVRPKWPDGTYAYTIKKFGVVNRYDLLKNSRQSHFEKHISVPLLMRFCGYGRKSPIMYMI